MNFCCIRVNKNRQSNFRTTMSNSEESEEELHDIDWSENDPFFDYEDPFALSPQISAVIENDVKRFKLLLKSGKSVNINDNNGNTPLHLAVLKDKAKIFHYLMTVKDVRINAVNFDGTTPLTLALLCANENFALELIRKGADVNVVNNRGYTPLHYAVANSLKVAKILIKKGADINARNCLGETPLYIACDRGNCDVIHMLLYYGADVTIPSYEGTLPFTLVLSKCPTDLQEIFFNYTFDEEKIPVILPTLTVAMVAKSALFYPMIEKTSELVYDENDLKQLNESLPYIDSRFFRVFLEKFEDVARDMFSICNSLMDYVTFLGTFINEKPNFVGFFYVLCESPLISAVVENYNPKVFLIHSIIGRNISEDILTKLVCCLLSHGIDVISDDLNSVYKHYGFCELFKIMLHMDIVDYTSHSVEANYETFLMPILIYDVHLNIECCLNDPNKYLFPSNAQKLSKFFAIPKLREYLSDNSVLDKIKHTRVPSLIELGRNAARKYIIARYNVKKSVHYFTVLKWLPINDVYKAILSYEKELYKI